MRKTGRLRKHGFTLVELLVVIAIIGILVGIVIGVGGNVQKKAAASRAKAEISAIELSLERYKIDNGDYPDWPNISGSTVYAGDPTAYSSNLVGGATAGQRSLFEQLVGRQNYDDDVVTGVQYYEVKESQSGMSGNDGYFQDPFGLPYGYRYDTSATGTTPKSIFNQVAPDIWSTAGETTTPSNTDDYVYLRWITNWISN